MLNNSRDERKKNALMIATAMQTYPDTNGESYPPFSTCLAEYLGLSADELDVSAKGVIIPETLMCQDLQDHLSSFGDMPAFFDRSKDARKEQNMQKSDADGQEATNCLGHG